MAKRSGTDISRDLPASPIIFLDNRVGLGHAVRLQVGRVPADESAGPQSEHTEQDDSCQPGTVGEIAPGRLASLARIQPLPMVAGRARQRRLGLLELSSTSRAREQTRRSAGSATEDR